MAFIDDTANKTIVIEPVKLVRDNIPQIMEKSGVEPIWRVAAEDEFYEFLLKKLQEEVDELKAAKEHKHILEECADVYEVLIAIIGFHDFANGGWEEWLQILNKKRAERGQFNNRIILEGVEKYDD